MALGDTIQLQLLYPVTGYGRAGDIITTVETLTTEAMVTNGFAVLYTGSTPSAYVPLELGSGTQVFDTATQQRIRTNLGIPNANALIRQHRRDIRLGSATTDLSSVAVGSTSSLGRTYSANVGAGVVNTAPPWQEGEGLDTAIVTSGGGNLWTYRSNPPGLPFHSYRVMSDSTEVDVALWNTLGTSDCEVFIDNAPYASNPVAITGNQYLKLNFATAQPRLIEVRTRCALLEMRCGSIYRLWKPRALHAPRVLFVGASYGVVVWNGASASTDSKTPYFEIGDYLDTEDVWVDCIAGTGFIRRTSGLGTPNNNFLDRLAQHIRVKPDLLVLESGAANDLFEGDSNSAIISAATSYITQARAALPDTKIAYVEGFTPPVSFSTFGSSYATISAALLTACAAAGIYVIDTTTDPWIAGTGYTPGHTTGDGNADFYIGNDGIHPTIAGANFLKRRLAPKLQSILYGTAVVNTKF